MQTLNSLLIECGVLVPLTFVHPGGSQQFLEVYDGILNLSLGRQFQPLPSKLFLGSFSFSDCVITTIINRTTSVILTWRLRVFVTMGSVLILNVFNSRLMTWTWFV